MVVNVRLLFVALAWLFMAAGAVAQNIAPPAFNGAIGATGFVQTPAPSSGGVPSWVATTCPLQSNPAMCIDFANNREWDGISSTLKTATADLSLTRSTTETVRDASDNFSTVSAGNFAISSAGLQIMGPTNLLTQTEISTGTSLNTGWGTLVTTLAAPTINGTIAGGGPGGVDQATDVTFPSSTATGQRSGIFAEISTTTGTQYTCGMWIKGVNGNEQVLLFEYEATVFSAYATKIVDLPATPAWQFIKATFTSTHTEIGANGTVIEIGVDTRATSIALGAASSHMPLLTGGRILVSMPQCSLGQDLQSWVPTSGTIITAPVVDNISATGDLSTALKASAGTAVLTTMRAPESVVGTFLGNNSAVFFGKTATDTLVSGSMNTAATGYWPGSAESSSISWGSGTTDQVGLNGSLSSAGSIAAPAGATTFLGSTSGTASGILNGNILTLAVYTPEQTLVATSSQPVTGFSYGGLEDYYGFGAVGATYNANHIQLINVLNGANPNITTDTPGMTWPAAAVCPNAVACDFDTTADTSNVTGSNAIGLAAASSSYGIISFTDKGTGDWTQANIMGNVFNGNLNFGGPGLVRTCPTAAGGDANCNWKPGNILAVGCGVVAGCTGGEDFLLLLGSARDPTDFSLTKTEYSTVGSSQWSGTAWGSWTGLPTTTTLAVSPVPFMYDYLYSNGSFVQFGQNYAAVSGNPDNQNSYIFAWLYKEQGSPATAPIIVRFPLNQINTQTNLQAVTSINSQSISAGSSAGGTVTLTVPNGLLYQVNTAIDVSGTSVWDASWRVTANSATTVSFATATTGTVSTGTVAQSAPTFWQYCKGNGVWSSSPSDWATVHASAANAFAVAQPDILITNIQYLPAQNTYLAMGTLPDSLGNTPYNAGRVHVTLASAAQALPRSRSKSLSQRQPKPPA